MASRIDDKTVVPLGIVALLFSVGIGVTIRAAFWVKGVDDKMEVFNRRFCRMERKLGIDVTEECVEVAASADFIPKANAGVIHRGLDSKKQKF